MCPVNHVDKTNKHLQHGYHSSLLQSKVLQEEAGEAALPVTEVVDCTKGVAGAGQAAAGAIGEVALLAVLTLKTSVPRQTRTLTGAQVTLVRIQNPLRITAAVTKAL